MFALFVRGAIVVCLAIVGDASKPPKQLSNEDDTKMVMKIDNTTYHSMAELLASKLDQNQLEILFELLDKDTGTEMVDALEAEVVKRNPDYFK